MSTERSLSQHPRLRNGYTGGGSMGEREASLTHAVVAPDQVPASLVSTTLELPAITFVGICAADTRRMKEKKKGFIRFYDTAQIAIIMIHKNSKTPAKTFGVAVAGATR